MIGGQILIVFVGGKVFTVTPLNSAQWAISVVLGVLCIPFGIITRLIPDEFLNKWILVFEGAKHALARRIRPRAVDQ
jgi:P-type Ca2+ transporter type 2C